MYEFVTVHSLYKRQQHELARKGKLSVKRMPCWASSALWEMSITRALRDALLPLLLAEEPGPDSRYLTPTSLQQQYLPTHSFLSKNPLGAFAVPST